MENLKNIFESYAFNETTENVFEKNVSRVVGHQIINGQQHTMTENMNVCITYLGRGVEDDDIPLYGFRITINGENVIDEWMHDENELNNCLNQFVS